MEENGWTGRTVTLKYKLDTFQGMWSVTNVTRVGCLSSSQCSRVPNPLIAGSKPKKNFTQYVIVIPVAARRLTVPKTGKGLLLAETPLTLRLIGLRITKLKDLKAPAVPSGIKRVCGSNRSGIDRLTLCP
jgi:DNA polymerase kappa